jgi:hypothetical protein
MCFQLIEFLTSELAMTQKLNTELKKTLESEAKEHGEVTAALEIYQEISELLEAEVHRLLHKLQNERSARARTDAVQDSVGRIAEALGRLKLPG